MRVYVEAQSDARARLEQRMRLAALEETRLGETEAARATTALAIRDALAEPELPTLLDNYERLAGPARLAEVTALYREISVDVLDEALKLRLERTIADAAIRQGDGTLAAEYHRRVLDRVPDDDRALVALEQIYRQAGDNQALYDILIRRAELAQDPLVEQRLRSQMGSLAETALDQLDDAIAAYERVLEIAPREREAVPALERLYSKAERWADLTRLLEDLLGSGTLAERDTVGPAFPPRRDRARSPERQGSGARTPAAGAGRGHRPPGRDQDARGDARATSRCGGRRRSCSSRCTPGGPTGRR